MSKIHAWIPSLALAFSAAAVGIVGYDHLNPPANSNVSTPDLVNTVMPVVVNIGLIGKHPLTGEDVQVGVGSGFIIDGKNGYIVTNDHVAGSDKVEKIIVTLQGDKKYVAKLVGTDKLSDIAVLQIKTDTVLPQAVFGNSDTIHSGETVIAIGSPRGLSNSVTRGIISTTNRDVGNPIQHLIQSDAAINPGNSGGPLFNSKGQVIGVNELIYSTTGGWAGLGFAIPSNMVKLVSAKLIADGEIKWGFLGINMKMSKEGPVKSTDELADPKNIKIETVTPDSPADKAGLKAGDFIVSINGKAVNDSGTISSEVARLMAGGKPNIGYIRDGVKGSTVVTLGERPKPPANAKDDGENEDDDGKPPAPEAVPMPNPTPKGDSMPAPGAVPMPSPKSLPKSVPAPHP